MLHYVDKDSSIIRAILLFNATFALSPSMKSAIEPNIHSVTRGLLTVK